MSRKKTMSTLGIASCLLTGAALADSEAVDQDSVDEVVVTGRFIQKSGKSALKMDVPATDVPFSMVTYGEAFMDAVDTPIVAELYNYMAGVQRAGSAGFDVTIRGFRNGSSDRNAVLVDGLPGIGTRVGSPSTSYLENVEVLKGPASVLYGRAQPGGLINLITKKPEADFKGAVDLRTKTFSSDASGFGDDLQYSGSVDFTGPIDQDEKFLYRFVAEYGESDSFRDYVKGEEAMTIVPSLAWNISDRTTLTMRIEYRESDGVRDDGLIAPGLDYRRIAPITTFYGEPSDITTEVSKSASLTLNHIFNDSLTWNLALRRSESHERLIGYNAVAIRPNQLTMSRRLAYNDNRRSYSFVDSQFVIKFATGGVDHNLLAGLSGGVETSDFDRKFYTNLPASGDISVYNPTYGNTPNVTHPPASSRVNETKVYGGYLTDMMTLGDHWKAVAGVRWEKEKSEGEEIRLPSDGPQRSSASKALPMLGLVYQPNSSWSIYSSYSTAYLPPAPNAVPVDPNRPLAPQSGKQYEVGTKFESGDGNASVTLALFQINKENVLINVGSQFFDQTGEEEAKGAEIEANVLPLDNWQLTTSYSYVDVEIVSDLNPARVGLRPANAPEHSASILSRYNFTGPLEGFGFGVGYVYRSKRNGTVPGSLLATGVLELPGYSIADLSLYYTGDEYDVSLKLGNVFDEKYYQGSFNDLRIIPGDPRSLSLSMRKKF